MTNRKSTKKALLSSILSLVLCMAMLIGTTFAWFTDNVTSTGNKIQAGTLKVDLELLDKETKKWNSLKTSPKAIFDYDKWEPGYTDVKILKVENEGTLALKWMAKFVSTAKLTKLADVIDVYVCPSATELAYPDGRTLSGYTRVGTVADFVNTIETTTTGSLEANETAYLGIALKMQETAGNEYQNMSLGGAFDIQIVATQLTSEFDSFDNQYDKDAIYYDVLVSSADELYDAVEAASGDVVIAIDGNIALTKTLSKSGLNSIKFVALDEDATIDQATYNMHFQGAKVTFDGLTLTHGEKKYGDGGQSSTAFAVWNAVEVNYIDCTFNRSVGTLHAAVHNFIGCTFNGVYNPDNALSEYPLYICDGQDYNVTDCVFNATNRGAILFYNDGGDGVDTLNISNTKFLGDIIADKTAVEIHNNSNTQVYNVNIKDVIVGDGVINGLYRIKPANVGEVNVNVDGVSEVATASDKAGLTNAINNAETGDIIYLNTDIDCGAGQLAIEKDITIDLNENTLNADYGYGIISVKNGASLKNGTVDVKSNVAAIRAFDVGSIEDVTINITPKATEKVTTGIAVQNGGHVGTIKNVTITGATQGIEVAKGAKVDLIDNVNVKAVSNGSKDGTALIINAGYVGKAVNCNFSGEVYGVHMMLNGEFTVGLELEKCTVAGGQAGIYAHDEVGIANTNNCSLTLTYDAETAINGGLSWEFEEECKDVVTLNAPSGN